MKKLRQSRFLPALPILVALAYGASPLDLIPDFIPLIGVLDDGMIALIAFVLCIAALRRHVAPKPVRSRVAHGATAHLRIADAFQQD